MRNNSLPLQESRAAYKERADIDMVKKEKQRRSPTLIKWYLSYLLIILLSIAAGVGTSFYARSVSLQQAIQIHEGLMNQVQLDIDSYIQGIMNLNYRITLNSNVSRLLSTGDSRDPYNIYQIARDFQNYKSEAYYAYDVFLYDKDQDAILSSAGYLDGSYFYSLYYSFLEDDYETFQGRFDLSSYRELIYLNTSIEGRAGQIIALVQKIIPIGSNKELLACALLEPNYLAGRLNYTRWDEDISLVIQDTSFSPIAHAGPLSVDAAVASINDTEGFYIEEINDEEYGIFTQSSALVPWEYVTFVPTSTMYRSADGIGLFAAVFLFICASIGVLLAYRFSMRNYTPLKEAIDVMAENLDSPIQNDAPKNEYAWLKIAAAAYVDKIQSSYEMLKNYNQYLKNHLLFRLLETPFIVHRDYQELQRSEWQFNQPFFLVINFYYTDNQAITLSTSIEQGKRTISLSIISAFVSRIESRYTLEMVDMGDRVSSIVNLPDRSPDRIEEIKADVSVCQETLESELNISVKCSIGTIHAGIAEIYLSSTEAKEAGGFISATDSNGIVLYEDIKNIREAYRYPLEQEQQIISYILAGNEEQAVAAAKRVYGQNESILAGEMQKCLILDMLGTVIKAANQTDSPNYLSQIDMSDIISGHKSQEKLLIAISELCRKVNSDRSQNKRNSGLVSSVRQYVHEYYNNPEMNVSAIGKHFFLTPAYLSSLFKEEKGISLPDYINMVRVEKAKELLSKRQNVNDVAIAVGFKTSGSFIRVFKKQEGQTPGQWSNHCGTQDTLQ